MAQATHNPAVTRTEVVEVKPATVTLHLSMEEAITIATLVAAVYGSCSSSPRKHTDAVYIALRKAGIQYTSASYESLVEKPRFKDNSL